MDTPQESLNSLSWRRDDERGAFLVSTRPALLNHDFINRAFASDDMDWARPLPEDQMATMLAQSITLGLYHTPPPGPTEATSDEPSSPRTPSPTMESSSHEGTTQIGLARYVTDRITLAYLTDVYILPEYRKLDLGKWLIACSQDVLKKLPAMRRVVLVTSPVVGKGFYSREMGMQDVRDDASKVFMTRRAYSDEQA